jgi:hypothetical protein
MYTASTVLARRQHKLYWWLSHLPTLSMAMMAVADGSDNDNSVQWYQDIFLISIHLPLGPAPHPSSLLPCHFQQHLVSTINNDNCNIGGTSATNFSTNTLYPHPHDFPAPSALHQATIVLQHPRSVINITNDGDCDIGSTSAILFSTSTSHSYLHDFPMPCTLHQATIAPLFPHRSVSIPNNNNHNVGSTSAILFSTNASHPHPHNFSAPCALYQATIAPLFPCCSVNIPNDDDCNVGSTSAILFSTGITQFHPKLFVLHKVAIPNSSSTGGTGATTLPETTITLPVIHLALLVCSSALPVLTGLLFTAAFLIPHIIPQSAAIMSSRSLKPDIPINSHRFP